MTGGETEDAYRRELATDPTSPSANHGLGRLLLGSRRPDLALPHLRTACEADPDVARYHDDLGRALNNLGRLDEAEAAFRRAVGLDPKDVEAHSHLGHVLRTCGRLQEAGSAFRHALELDPDRAADHSNLGSVLAARGELDAAIEHYRRAVELEPGTADHRFNLAQALERAGRVEEGIAELQRLVDRAPDDVDAITELAGSLRSEGALEEAEALYRRALSARPDHEPAVVGLASIHDIRGETEAGLDWLRQHADRVRSSPELTLLQARLALKLGRGNDVVDGLRSMAERPDLPPETAALLRYTLGDVFDRLGEHALAWRAYSEANAARPPGFGADALRERARRIRELFDAETLARLSGHGVDDELPVLIVGLPRSGTSLTEQILASHGQVTAGGELALLNRATPSLDAVASALRADRDPALATELSTGARSYLDGLRALAEAGARRVTDKMWQNYELLGWVQLMMPRARVVDCRRHPIDVVLSGYFQSFGRAGIPYTNDLELLAVAAEEHHRTMRHWHSVCDLDIHRLEYRTLVEDQEATTRSLVEAMGLDWDPSCLAFHRNARVTVTASVDQVKQPMYRSSLDRWRDYEPWLPDSVRSLPEKLAD